MNYIESYFGVSGWTQKTLVRFSPANQKVLLNQKYTFWFCLVKPDSDYVPQKIRVVVVTNRSKVRTYRFPKPVGDVNGKYISVWKLLYGVVKVMS